MLDKLDLFELSVKRGLENYEVPMEEGAWEQFQSHMINGSGSTASGNSSFLGKFGVAAAILTATGLFINYSSSPEQSFTSAEHSESSQHVDAYGVNDKTTYVVERVEESVEIASEEGLATESISESNATEAEEKRILNINKKLQQAADRAETEEKDLEMKTTTRYVGNSFNLGAPSEFSPNGDGKQDSFLPTALVADDRFILTISDVEGNRVYRSSKVDRPWNGKDLAGLNARQGIYTWEVILHKDNNNKEIFRGIVKLER